MKQTLEAPYEPPGPLRLDGPNVRFSDARQMLHKPVGQEAVSEFLVSVGGGNAWTLCTTFRHDSGQGIQLAETTTSGPGGHIALRPDMAHEQIVSQLSPWMNAARKVGSGSDNEQGQPAEPLWRVGRRRWSLGVELADAPREHPLYGFHYIPAEAFRDDVAATVHLPGIRGNPDRVYRVTGAGPNFPGEFHEYVASVIYHWQEAGDERHIAVCDGLKRLGLTRRVEARRLDDTRIELLVSRLPVTATSHRDELVNIADVGVGVSQVLPVLVALRAAEPGRLVYIEQPEIHLHPKAQVELARVLADAAKRGVRVVVETHSPILLLTLQTLVAEDEHPLSPDEVVLHWFTRRDDGVTEVTAAYADDAGGFSDSPEDFGDVELEAQSRFITAAEKRMGVW